MSSGDVEEERGREGGIRVERELKELEGLKEMDEENEEKSHLRPPAHVPCFRHGKQRAQAS